jgi:YD repeat-containing protein
MNHQFYEYDYTPKPVQNAPVSFSAVNSVIIPQRPQYQFTYSGYGMIYNISLSNVGGTATMTYNYPLGGEEQFYAPQFSQRTESPNAVYTYDASGVTRPDGSVLSLSPFSQDVKNSSGTSLRSTQYGYTTDPGGSQAVQSMISYDETGQGSKVGFDYDQYGNVVNKRDYGFKVNGVWQVRRRTHYMYMTDQAYIDAYLRSLLAVVEVF